ncbi:FtsK/SpoIIIE domain-containing protein [Microbacterium radiodurans]|uniref:Cell division protein FtsK n=1 Tax=Microbacterium radiodurans TaxID=661398 RepID=A0A5J5IW55_9MICO|nr:FtsK/SpoIIIE domain-containing protein [Microbacterium radiodurans]KAA9089939.1 cell division protein FtsK [Microbacterium radiodurans]
MQSDAVDDPIALPPRPVAPPRPPFPLWAAVVPTLGAVVLWRVSGSATVLWFAALGPLVAIATLIDARWARRRARRRARRADDALLAELELEIGRRHDRERRERWRSTPDVHRFLRAHDDIWRAGTRRGEVIVVGAGDSPSAVRMDRTEAAAAGDGDRGADVERRRRLRRQAAVLRDAPITVPLRAGIAVVGPAAVAGSIARALAAQVCLALPPGALEVRSEESESWMRELPQAGSRGAAVLWLGSDSAPEGADVPIVRVDGGMPIPPRCAAVIRVRSLEEVELDHEGATVPIRPSYLARDRTGEVAEALRLRASAVRDAAPGAPSFAELSTVPSHGLTAAIGADREGLVAVDLVADGPHAVVVGVTGSGKSELLCTWVAAMAQRRGPDEVSFLLVDFKGGSAFDPLRPLPHVAGVVTDLDDAATERAIASLAAEMRRRERALAAARVRDIADLDGALARLVVVVDEYAALVAAYPALASTFADVAARGRALGIHLVLATQRAAGFRDAVLANAPLRIALRVTDAADSRTVIGCIDAATLPGGITDRGTALVRGPADSAPRTVRVSRCTAEDIAAIAATWRERGSVPAHRPWLPALPTHLPLPALLPTDGIALGLVDEPGEQRQRTALLGDGSGLSVVGRSGAGRTTVLRTIAAQLPAERVVVIPADDLEAAWDAVTDLPTRRRGDVVLADDIDLLFARLPAEYAAEAAERLELCAREARGRGIRLVLGAQRLSGALVRVVDQLPARAILATTSAAERVALGGRSADHSDRMPPGRGHLDGELIQFAVVDDDRTGFSAQPVGAATPPWHPDGPVALVAPAGTATRSTLAAWEERGASTGALAAATGADAAAQVVWGAPEAWVGRWQVFSAAHPDSRLVVDAACAPDLRLITGRRTLPPYAAPGAGRAWLFGVDGSVSRVTLPREAASTAPPAGGTTRRDRRLRAEDPRA